MYNSLYRNQEKSMSDHIQKGDIVEILDRYQDPGDDQMIWVADQDEKNSRVSIKPLNSSSRLSYVIDTKWVRSTGMTVEEFF